METVVFWLFGGLLGLGIGIALYAMTNPPKRKRKRKNDEVADLENFMPDYLPGAVVTTSDPWQAATEVQQRAYEELRQSGRLPDYPIQWLGQTSPSWDWLYRASAFHTGQHFIGTKIVWDDETRNNAQQPPDEGQKDENE